MQSDVQGIGERIKSRRKGLGLTQRALADQVGIGADVISKHEHEKLGVSSETLMAYAKALKTTAEELAGESVGMVSLRDGSNVAPIRPASTGGVPREIARLLSDGRCNPVSDPEIDHLTRHLADGNSSEIEDLEVHLLAHRAERDRTRAAVETFKAAVLRASKRKGQHEPDQQHTQTRALPESAPTRKKPELIR